MKNRNKNYLVLPGAWNDAHCSSEIQALPFYERYRNIIRMERLIGDEMVTGVAPMFVPKTMPLKFPFESVPLQIRWVRVRVNLQTSEGWIKDPDFAIRWFETCNSDEFIGYLTMGYLRKNVFQQLHDARKTAGVCPYTGVAI